MEAHLTTQESIAEQLRPIVEELKYSMNLETEEDVEELLIETATAVHKMWYPDE